MAQKHVSTTSDYIDWDAAMNLVRRLFKDGNYRMSLLVGCGCFFGLRFSDLSQLSWRQLLSGDTFELYEQKTGKRRVIRINKGFQAHIRECYVAMKIQDMDEPCFLNRFGGILTNQMVNRHFKALKVKYQIRIKNFSTHSLRKTFGRRVVDMAGPDSEMAIIKLSELFNHSNSMVTRRYLGLRQEELGEVYDSLQF
ncbi:MAG: tyrosine-type recombinase/integrase [Bacteroidales bacterium]|nr:tyrosine-type recombinase/integrase [Bacteroidales bacterium]